MGDGMSVQGAQRNTGSLAWCGFGYPQPDAREGQAGPREVAETPVVPSKPGNAGGGKGRWYKTGVECNEDVEIGDEPGASGKSSEVTDGAARQSEGSAHQSAAKVT